MSTKYERLISTVGQDSGLADMIERGLTLQQVKEAIITLFQPYFEHRDTLARFALSYLLPEAVNLARLEQDRWGLKMFEECLGTHRTAKAVAPSASLEAVCAWVPDTAQGLSPYWSAFHLEREQDTLAIEEFAYQSTQLIGVLIEAMAKPYLKELLHQLRISRREPVTRLELDSLLLGEVVNELADKSGYPTLFEPPPWLLRLHKWRNVAQHHSTRVDAQLIICNYGTPSRPQQLTLSRGELVAVLQALKSAVAALKLANTVYFMDNFPQIQALGLLPSDPPIRPEMQVLTLQLQLASQGFELLDLRWDDAEAVVVIRELSTADPSRRRGHVSQFPLVLWQATKAPWVTVEYRERDGTPNFRVSAGGRDCEKVVKGERDLADFIKVIVEMIDLRTGYLAPPLPDDGVQSGS